MNNLDFAKIIEPAFMIFNILITSAIAFSLLIFILRGFIKKQVSFKNYIKPMLIGIATLLFYASMKGSYIAFEYPMYKSSEIESLNFFKGFLYSAGYLISYFSIIISLIIGILAAISQAFYPLIHRKRGTNHVIAVFALFLGFIWSILVNGFFLYLLTSNIHQKGAGIILTLLFLVIVLSEIALFKYYSINFLLSILNKVFPKWYDDGKDDIKLPNLDVS